MKLFLTSSPIGIYRSEESPDYPGFNPANGMTEEIRGEAYMIRDGAIRQICSNGDRLILSC